jgi:hypothetical protein
LWMERLLGFVFWSLLILGSDFGVTVCIVFLILLWSIAVKDLGVFLELVCCLNLLLGSIDVQCLYTELSLSKYTVVPGLKAEMNTVTSLVGCFMVMGLRRGLRIGGTLRDLLGRIALLGIGMMTAVIRSGTMRLLFRGKERIGLFVLQFRYIYGLERSIRCMGDWVEDSRVW